MDIAKLAKSVRIVGALLILGALLWWFLFYRELLADTDSNVIDALPCLVVSSGNCGLLAGLASLGGATPYNPVVFWVGVGVIAAGLILTYSLKKKED